MALYRGDGGAHTPTVTYVRKASLVAAAAVVLLASCSSSSSSGRNSITVTEKDFSLSATSSKVVKGNVTVTVKNEGSQQHELVFFRTDLDENNMPLEPDGRKIDEEGSGITHLDPEAEDLNPGDSKTITIDLPAGRYVVVCNIELHYKQGMHTVVTSA